MIAHRFAALVVALFSLGWIPLAAAADDFLASLVASGVGLLGLYTAVRLWGGRASAWRPYVIWVWTLFVAHTAVDLRVESALWKVVVGALAIAAILWWLTRFVRAALPEEWEPPRQP